MKKFPARFIKDKRFNIFAENTVETRFHRKGEYIVQYQGTVKDYDPDTGMALVVLFNWMDGSPCLDEKILEVTEDWRFYSNQDDQVEAYIETLPGSDQDWARKQQEFMEKVLMS